MRAILVVASIVQALLFCWPAAGAELEPIRLRCEYLDGPLGIDIASPRLGWELIGSADAHGLGQTGYRILVSSSREKLEASEGDLWDSGRIASDQSVNVAYAGKRLPSKQQCYWKVRVWDQDGAMSAWSRSARWTMGLLRAEDWRAQWVGTPAGGGPDRPSPWFRKVFSLTSRPRSAFVYVASIGYHEVHVNGRKVGDAVLAPSVSHLGRRVRYLTYEVTELLEPGANCVAVWLGNGWASHPEYKLADGAMFLLQIEATLGDGSSATVPSDGSWKTHASPITGMGGWKARQFGGERYDARIEKPGWSTAAFSDADWNRVRVFGPRQQTLSAETIEPDRLVERLVPASVQRKPDGSLRIDMGRSLTGWFEMPLRGPEGREISLEYSEREDEACSYGQRDVYVCSGRDDSPFRSRFNYHAFRWVTVRNLDRVPPDEDISGYLVRTGYDRAATFSCSNNLLNKIYQMTAWTYESLSLGGYLVDCPHRERLGYGGDAHATMETGMSQFRTAALYTKWLEDWRDTQQSTGEMPHTAPQMNGGGGPAWGGICVVLPWEVYRRFGDRRILEVSYPSIKKWLGFLDSKSAGDLLRPFTSFSTPGTPVWSFLGDWVPPGRGQDPGDRVDERSTHFFNNCYWILNLKIAADCADALALKEDARRYRERAAQVAAEVNRKYLDPATKTYVNGEQPYLAFPLLLEVVPPELRADVTERLERRISVTDRGHVNAGMHGTWLLWRYLNGIGRDDLLAGMMTQTTFPGWGHMIEQGATTVWEEWNGANSRLHSTLMGAGQWFTEGLAGIRPDDSAPGYKRFILAPALAGDVQWVEATFHSPYGEIGSSWKRDGGNFFWRFRVPPNTTATVHVPDPDARIRGTRFLRVAGAKAVLEAPSGLYEFRGRTR